MKCLTCLGACCESLHLAAAGERREFFVAFGARPLPAGEVEFDVRCSKLTPVGRCAIYAQRPMICRTYEPGGAACLDVVRRRRTPEQYAAIRDASDPEQLSAAGR